MQSLTEGKVSVSHVKTNGGVSNSKNSTRNAQLEQPFTDEITTLKYTIKKDNSMTQQHYMKFVNLDW